MSTSNRETGYYHALVAGASGADVILYYDGDHLYAHGSAAPVSTDLLLFIREKPICFKRPDGSYDAPFIGIEDWLTEV
jgi:hypothetical protein